MVSSQLTSVNLPMRMLLVDVCRSLTAKGSLDTLLLRLLVLEELGSLG